MIEISNSGTFGWEAAVWGMRNPMNSWDKSDSEFGNEEYGNGYAFKLGQNDLSLMRKLADGGPTHAKYRRMITVHMDILAPLYWWKEFDTYKVGTVANSCSTMHKIHSKPFEISDFSTEHLISENLDLLEQVVERLNVYRDLYMKTKDKKYWWQLIQLLPSSYNQRRTIMTNYEVLHHIYYDREGHKLDEWREDFRNWIESLPYFDDIIR